jgi:fatty acid desaturase
VSHYTDLARTIRQSGLLRRRYAFYWTRIGTAVASFLAIWTGFFVIGNSWFQLLLAAALALVVTQFGFLGHDSAHRQVFISARWNEWTSRACATVFAGLSYTWWLSKHNKHHAAPNEEGRDPDIGPGAIAFTRSIADNRTTGFAGWFVRRQGWLFFPLTAFEGLVLHVSSITPLVSRRATPRQRCEAAVVVVRLSAYILVLLLFLPMGKAGAFFGVQMGIFGLCLGGAFAPNHKGMPIVPGSMKIDFLQRQVLTSRNVRGGLLVDFAMGGLNYQIEHHLFPSMPRPNLRLAQPVVRAYCVEHGVPYTEVGLFESYGIVIDYLNHVGLRAQEPVTCPLAAQYRA